MKKIYREKEELQANANKLEMKIMNLTETNENSADKIDSLNNRVDKLQEDLKKSEVDNMNLKESLIKPGKRLRIKSLIFFNTRKKLLNLIK